MPGITVKEYESWEASMRRFKREVDKAQVLHEMRRREFYEPPSVRRKKAYAAAVKRFKKKQMREARFVREHFVRRFLRPPQLPLVSESGEEEKGREICQEA